MDRCVIAVLLTVFVVGCNQGSTPDADSNLQENSEASSPSSPDVDSTTPVPTPDPVEMESASFEGVSFEVPKNWMSVPNIDKISYISPPPKDFSESMNGASFNIANIPADDTNTPEALAEAELKAVKIFGNFDSETELTISGHPAKKYVTISKEGNHTMKRIRVICVLEKSVLVFKSDGYLQGLDNHGSTIDHVITSLKVGP